VFPALDLILLATEWSRRQPTTQLSERKKAQYNSKSHIQTVSVFFTASVLLLGVRFPSSPQLSKKAMRTTDADADAYL
jgi:hypothetical protein